MKFELYESLSQGTFTFFKQGDEKQVSLLEADAKLVCTIEAGSWGEAADKKDEFIDSYLE